MLWLLLASPLTAACLAFALPWNWPRRVLLVAAAALHLGTSVSCAVTAPSPILNRWIALDATSLLFLLITSSGFLVVALYAVGYLQREGHWASPTDGDAPFVNFPEAVFTGCLLLFLAAMTLVVVSQHWGLMWVAVEATTLASAPLIYFHRSARSLEATWKYLMICSVGIALALLGNFFLAVAAHGGSAVSPTLIVGDLESQAASLNPLWLKAAFLLLLVGYGTKMGLAPMHTWLPDAHSEAPSLVSALLSGVLLNCAFLAILRGHSLLVHAGLADFSGELLVLFGLASMLVASVFVIRQMDYKRLLAYSSVEHMGILALGVGIGGVAGFGSMLHAVNHSLTKAMLFLVAGNTLAHFKTKSAAESQNIRRLLPVNAFLWIVGLLAITGSPPFGMFHSELAILKGAVNESRILVAVLYLVALGIIFVGMSAVILKMVYGVSGVGSGAGSPGGDGPTGALESPGKPGEPLWSLLPPLLLASAITLLGVYLPQDLSILLHEAAVAVGAE